MASPKLPLLAALSILLLAGLLLGSAAAQSCGCGAGYCCSRYGYCGKTSEYCGAGCREGPCERPAPTNPSGVKVADIVTQAFFDSIIGQAASNCAGKRFYSRGAFLNALASYPRFGTVGSPDDSKREIAAFFAHVTHETGHLCNIEEVNGPNMNYCDPKNTDYPCVPGKGYYGRGPLQVSWNYNYGAAGRALSFDGLRAPETLATDVNLSFRASLWYWMINAHADITSRRGFGYTTRAINGRECEGKNLAAVNSRIRYYQDYCTRFGVSPGENLSC